MMKQALEEFDKQQKDKSPLSPPPTSPPPTPLSPDTDTQLPKHQPSSSMADYDLIKMRYLRSLNIPIESRRKTDPVGGVAASAPIPIPTGSFTKRLELEGSDSERSEDEPEEGEDGAQRRKRRAHTIGRLPRDFVPPHQLVGPSTFTVKHSIPVQYQDYRKKNMGL
eukprot:TRINITY_DN634_c0_g1_i2.p1 TRINITY_DN634_c0_g1~~TRINITY_DN634_c0_g1_i2.p1  ORF type:complete len:166 (+),score=58.12 TRINITY_DN634_c0_g1_i2:253-750(+)